MGRSQETNSKKEIRKKKDKKRKDKEKKRLAKKDGEKLGSLDSMIAYVDEFGNITDTPPEPNKTSEIKSEDIEIGVPRRQDDEEADRIKNGVLSFFNESKGFGFIRDSKTQERIFVHINNIIEEIKEGNIVSFELERGPKGLIATQVKLYKAPEPDKSPEQK